MPDIHISRAREFSAVRPYTYTITRKGDNMQYHGVRYGNVRAGLSPTEDLGTRYFSSGVFKKEYKAHPENFTARIRWTFPNKQAAMIWESRVNGRLIRRKNWANAAIGKGCTNLKKMKLRRELALLNKYGVPHNMQIESVKVARDKTIFERYGVNNIGQSLEIRKKVIETSKKKFGVECSFQAESVKEKSRLTLLKKFGVDNANKSLTVREKTKSTNLAKFGCEYNFQSIDVKEKIAQKRKDMYIALAKMTDDDFSKYLLTISQHKAIQSQKKSQRRLGIAMLGGKIYA